MTASKDNVLFQLGKRNEFLGQGDKHIPRIGKHQDFSQDVEELKFYNHIQPMDSKFVLDFLTKELFQGDHDLKFVAWNDFDAALETDTEFKQKLELIAKEKKIDELKKLAEENAEKEQKFFIERPSTEPRKFYQKFIPYDASDSGVRENDDFYYNVDVVKRG